MKISRRHRYGCISKVIHYPARRYRYGDRTVTWRDATREGVVPGGGVARLGGVALARRRYIHAGVIRASGKAGFVAALEAHPSC
ncbi:hypothetical protein GOBAR_DD19875 [Gossypium barbadense]|nr:hypothetical protein GOBAR_DD19875 [Gossypium barbadense]